VCATGAATAIATSTITGNTARVAGGVVAFGGIKIVGSTLSNNSADHIGAVGVLGGLDIDNSTIVFNHDRTGSYSAAVFSAQGNLSIQSSILSGNGGDGSERDLSGTPTSFQGSNNIIVSSYLVTPADTITDCPRLQPLADNGGRTLTHRPSSSSPAIDAGSNPLHLASDQTGGPREVGAAADIGSVEWAGNTDERLLAAGFDGLCDQ
jgi:hypothetical protein